MTQEATQALVKIGPNKDAEIAKLVTQAEGLLKYAQDRTISNVDDVKSATEDLSLIAILKKAMEEKRKEYVGPLNAHVKSINDTFKTLMSPVEEANQLTRGKVMAYRAEEERKAAEVEEINRLRLEADRKEAVVNEGVITESPPPIPMPEAPAKRVHTAVGTAGTRMDKKWEIEDFANVPDEYKLADAAKIGRVVRAGGTIAGVRIWEEETLTVRSR